MSLHTKDGRSMYTYVQIKVNITICYQMFIFQHVIFILEVSHFIGACVWQKSAIIIVLAASNSHFSWTVVGLFQPITFVEVLYQFRVCDGWIRKTTYRNVNMERFQLSASAKFQLKHLPGCVHIVCILYAYMFAWICLPIVAISQSVTP